MKIAAAAYQPSWHQDWASLSVKLDAWVSDAKAEGADLLVFPEYAGVEAALIRSPQAVEPDVTTWVDRSCGRAADWAALHTRLAKKYEVYILAGSLPVRSDGLIVNAATLCAPSGKMIAQEKLILTPYEREVMKLNAGRDLRLIETALGKIGILICYDSEFPLLARSLVVAGADMILVPSCTEFAAGQTRVRQSSRARAIEGQCLLVQAPLVGAVEGCEIIDRNTGRAGLFCPPDFGLPAGGIIAQGPLDQPGWTIAEVDPRAIAQSRTIGQVSNFGHWDEQDARIKTVSSATLR